MITDEQVSKLVLDLGKWFVDNLCGEKRRMPKIVKTAIKPNKPKRGRPKKISAKKKSGYCWEKGCGNLARAKGLCSLHYQRERYHEKHPNAKTRGSHG